MFLPMVHATAIWGFVSALLWCMPPRPIAPNRKQDTRRASITRPGLECLVLPPIQGTDAWGVRSCPTPHRDGRTLFGPNAPAAPELLRHVLQVPTLKLKKTRDRHAQSCSGGGSGTRAEPRAKRAQAIHSENSMLPSCGVSDDRAGRKKLRVTSRWQDDQESCPPGYRLRGPPPQSFQFYWSSPLALRLALTARGGQTPVTLLASRIFRLGCSCFNGMKRLTSVGQLPGLPCPHLIPSHQSASAVCFRTRFGRSHNSEEETGRCEICSAFSCLSSRHFLSPSSSQKPHLRFLPSNHTHQPHHFSTSTPTPLLPVFGLEFRLPRRRRVVLRSVVTHF
ncbi:hypothetical protein B0T11DRAFT_84534 [Plectosphaerella cucumerina]|uniref:Secreted protein n=1 Tax=Plectosphaerella cucumerina TaxID=40658 RepID=A0A8K0TEJ3_9PEZI|nr:hypothetical protein B0T11DRAFT_84534 [Plectosphaerella cucumerina]